MPKKANRSRELRQLAKGFLAALPDEALSGAGRDDLAGALVRQWLTYDRNATLLLGEQMLHLKLEATPLGRWRVAAKQVRRNWESLTGDWKIDPSEIPHVMARLNLAQSAEVTNLDGALLRIWVDPKERRRGVEPLAGGPLPPGPGKRDYHKLAGKGLHSQLGTSVAADELEALTQSVAAQWKQYQGNAFIILHAREQLVFTLVEQEDGDCNMTVSRQSIELEPLLASFGAASEAVSEVIGRLNLGHRAEFRDRSGIPRLMWHDPKTRRINVQQQSTASESEGPAHP